jgi:short-subunit dehydrogenase
MSNTALITGASSGIGKEFARYHASKGGDVILTARREAELLALKDELEKEYKISAHVFAIDLGAPNGAIDLIKAVTDAKVDVDILINNAGFGGQGLHIERDLALETAMINLNVTALVTLTHAFGNKMAARGSGKIDQELQGTGVTCTVLAPGLVETEFVKVAKLEGTSMVKGNFATAESVAKHGYDAMMAGKLVTINDRSFRFIVNWIMPLMPRRMMLKSIFDSQSK